MFETEREKWMWLACAIDAEGSICIWESRRTKSHNVEISIGTINKEWTQLVADILGSNIQTIPSYKSPFGKSTFYRTKKTGKSLLPILHSILPFLIIKKIKAINAIEYINKYDIKTREEYMKFLNSKEPHKKGWVTRHNQMYVCKKCLHYHKYTSIIGKEHQK